MEYSNPKINEAAQKLREELKTAVNKTDILKSPLLRSLYADIAKLNDDERPTYGRELNQLKQELKQSVNQLEDVDNKLEDVDLTAPYDINVPSSKRPHLLSARLGARHPLMSELDTILDIFYRMGFQAVESRQLDDDYHMFEALNFPKGHPARDDYDTFMTTEGLIAPAHTSTMQNRILQQGCEQLDKGQPIATVIPGRVFRNENLDSRHEHTFYQLEGIYVAKQVSIGNLLATLQTFFEAYFGKSIEVKTQPFYFPFTEPSLEFACSCPFCNKKGCSVCGYSGWMELLGCGMIHPNVLSMAGIDPNKYSGFAWGGGVDRLVMMKYDIEDVRYFEAARLDFLRQFS